MVCFTLLTGICSQIEAKFVSCSITSSSSNRGNTLQTAYCQVFSHSYAFPLHCLMEEKRFHHAASLKAVVTCTNQTTAPLSENNNIKAYEIKIPDFIEKEEMQMIMTSKCIDTILKYYHAAHNVSNFFQMFKC